jgi:hypothetical protein
MLTRKRVGLTRGVAALVVGSVLAIAPAAFANTYSDQGAAVLVWPKIVVRAADPATDTLIQISNLDRTNTTAAHCFYVNANSHCANTGAVCETAGDCQQDGIFAPCVEGWIEVDFDVVLTPNQPLAWLASEGLSGSDIPCPGTLGSSCSGNQGTRVPPVTERPFIGELKCIQSDPITRSPAVCSGSACQNDLAGNATVFEAAPGEAPDGLGYNAVGLRTFGDNNGDRVLQIGGDGAEYEPCHDVLILNHFFDGAVDPISDDAFAETELTLVPCTEDFLTQKSDAVTAQFLVYNEFEQRFSTSRQVRCLLDSLISNLDTSQSDRSIFSVGTAGTLGGQTRIHGVGGGLIGAALLYLDGETREGGAGYNLNGFAERADGDQIRVP